MLGEVRNFNDNEVEKMYQEMTRTVEEVVQANKGKVKITPNREYYAFLIKEEEAVIRKVQQAGKKLGIDIKLSRRGGGSDTNIFNYRGKTSLNLGMGYSDNHTNNEQITVDELVRGTELIIAILEENVK